LPTLTQILGSMLRFLKYLGQKSLRNYCQLWLKCRLIYAEK
jgi:hypothetical protein